MRLKPLMLGVAVLASGFADAPTFVEVASFSDPSPIGFSYFGFSVAIGDRFLVVGDPADGILSSLVGEVHVFSGGTESILHPPATFSADDVGASVEFGIDVSACGNRFAATDRKRTFVFRHDRGQWIPEGVIPYGGVSISLEDRELAIGVGELSGGLGSVVIFRLDSGLDVGDPNDDTWVEDAWITGGASGDAFGWDVVLRKGRLLVGAPLGLSSGVETGLAYVFERDHGGVWVESAVLEPVGATADAHFGRSLAMEGSLALVGAPLNFPTNMGSGKGVAYAYRKDPVSGAWTSEGKLAVRGNTQDDMFGISVAIDGGTVFVGAYLADHGTGFGAVYPFEPRRLGDGTVSWHAVDKIPESGSHTNGLGYCIAAREGGLLVGGPFDEVLLFAAE